MPVNILLLDEAAGLLHLGHFTAFGFGHCGPFATRSFEGERKCETTMKLQLEGVFKTDGNSLVHSHGYGQTLKWQGGNYFVMLK